MQKLAAWSWRFLRALLIIGISYIIIFPLISKISTSLMSQADLWDATVRWIPRNWTLGNYSLVSELMNYPTALRNSFALTLVVSVFQLVACTIIGYGFARLEFPGSNILFTLVLLTLMIPPQVVIIPQYLNFRFFNIYGLIPGTGINLIGSFWPFILTALTGAGMRNGIFIFIMRQFFMGMPTSIEEAAYVDGAGPFTCFYTVMLPNAVPALVTVFLFAFVWQWNDYYHTSLLMGGKELLTVTIGRLGSGTFDPETLTLRNNTGMLMIIAPLLLLYTFMQRYFVESVERTGLVE